jgi:hypothetical protein
VSTQELDWFGETITIATKEEAYGPPNPNPCIATYGPDPEGRACRDCAHLLHLKYHTHTYIKCDLRKIAHSSQSDHRAKWDACSRFEQRGPEEEEKNDA